MAEYILERNPLNVIFQTAEDPFPGLTILKHTPPGSTVGMKEGLLFRMSATAYLETIKVTKHYLFLTRCLWAISLPYQLPPFIDPILSTSVLPGLQALSNISCDN